MMKNHDTVVRVFASHEMTDDEIQINLKNKYKNIVGEG